MSKVPTDTIASSILDAAKETLSNPFIVELMTRKVKFENWLQVELARRLSSSKDFTAVHMEGSAENGQAVDLKCQLVDGSCVGVEIKMYVCGKAVSNTRESIAKDIQKLQQLCGGGFVLVAVYGYREASKDRSNALLRVEEALKPLKTYPKSTQDVDLYVARVEGA